MFYGNEAFGLDDLAAAETQTQQGSGDGTQLFQPGDISNILNTASQNAQQWMQWEAQRKAALTPQMPAPAPHAPAPSVQQPAGTPWGKIAVGVAVAGVAIFGGMMLMKKRKTAENPRRRSRNPGKESGSWKTIGE